MNETFGVMRKLATDHSVDSSKLTVWKFMTRPTDEGSGGASYMEWYWYMLFFCMEHNDGSMDKMKAALFTADRKKKIPALVPPDLDQW